MSPNPISEKIRAAFDAQNWPEAETLCKAQLQHQPNDHLLHYNLASALLNQKKIEEAAQTCIALHQQKPDFAPAIALLGRICLAAHKIDKAIDNFIIALNADPNDLASAELLANAYLQANKVKEALSTFARLSKMGISHPQFLSNYAVALSRAGDQTKAKELFDKSLANAPADATLFANYGSFLSNTGQYHEAKQMFLQALQHDRDNLHAKTGLASLALIKRNFIEAEKLFLECEVEIPESFEVLNGLGTTYAEMGLWHQALNRFKKLMEQNNHIRSICKKMSDLCIKLNLFEEAIFYCDHGLSLPLSSKDDIANRTFYRNKSNALLFAGRISAREELIQHLLDKDPISAIYPISVDWGKTPDLNLVEEFKQKLEEAPESTKRYVLTPLGRLFEKCGDYEQAMACFEAYHEILRDKFDETEDLEATLNSSKIFFDEAFFTKNPITGSQDSRPLFIVGMARSGTTLLETSLSRHPEITGAGELTYLENTTFQMGHITSDIREYPYTMTNLSPEDTDKITANYLELLANFDKGEKFIIDKLPSHFKHIGFLSSLFPNARFIHCTRHPVATCLSIYQQSFAGTHSYAHSLETLGDYYVHYREIMAYWKTHLGDRIIDVSYEDFTENPKVEIQKILSFLNVENQEDLLNQKASAIGKTASLGQASKNVYQYKVDHWKNYESFLAPLLEKFSDKGIEV